MPLSGFRARIAHLTHSDLYQMMEGTDKHYRLIALDIDGTVLDSEGRVSVELKEVLCGLTAPAVRTVLCTGRRWRSTVPVFNQLDGLCTYVVCCGGALIKESDSGDTVFSDPLEDDAARRAATIYRRFDMVPIFLYDEPLEEAELLVSEDDRERAEDLKYIRMNADAVSYFPGPFPKRDERCLEIYTVDRIARVRRAIDDIRRVMGDSGAVRAMIQPRYGEDHLALEVHGPKATKWRALQWLMEEWSIEAEDVVAVGDDVNDIPMLRGAGLSFAMGNAGDRVKAVADRITSTNDEHGVAEALRNVFADTTVREL